jgi:hypothetical protein
MSAQDCGLFIHRPYVTVRGIAFRNFLVREKWSTGVDLRVDHIVVEDCRSSNCSLGFIVTGNDNVVRRCATEDVGGGVYVGGENATVEGCRLHKQRDSFMVPMYAQDDTGVQYYSPARGGAIRGNLCEGFGMGFISQHGSMRWSNTLVGGAGPGIRRQPHPATLRYNIIAVQPPVEVTWRRRKASRATSITTATGPPRAAIQTVGATIWWSIPVRMAAVKDYRLANDSPCQAGR